MLLQLKCLLGLHNTPSTHTRICCRYLQSRTWLAGLGADLGGAVLQIASFAMAPVRVCIR